MATEKASANKKVTKKKVTKKKTSKKKSVTKKKVKSVNAKPTVEDQAIAMSAPLFPEEDSQPEQPKAIVAQPKVIEVKPKAIEAQSKDDLLTVKLSKSLYQKLRQKSEQEGISLNDFASELLAEGLVLRAWEIMERKAAMRGPSNNSNQQGRFANNGVKNNNRNGSFRQNKNNRSNGNGNGNGNRRNANYNAIMGEKDNSSFLEYVRSQEKSINR